MKKSILVLLLSGFWAFALGQERVITGRVTAADGGEPLPGVNVVVQGTTKGSSTDVNGNYSVTLTSGENTLVFTFVGYKTVTADVGNRTVVDISFEDDVAALDEIVVVGYGTQREKDLTSSIVSLKAEELVKTPSGQVLQALQGKLAGVQVVSAGSPGASPTIRIRGVGSYPGNNQEGPLFVVDGMFFDNIDFLNPADIAKISVLKDASASAIYGVRAANGVVQIETKKGGYGQQATIVYEGYYGVQVAQNVLQMANAEQYTTMALESGSATDAGFIQNAMQRFGRSRVNPNVPNVNTDWYKEILRPAPIQNHSLSVSGGGEKTTYSLGANYFFQDGILDMKNNYERFNLRSKIDYHANDWLTVGGNFILSNATQFNPEGGAWNQAYFAVPILPVYDEQKTNAVPMAFANAQDLGYRNGQNPFPTMAFNENRTRIRKVLTNFYARVDLLEDKLFFQTTYNNSLTFLNERNIDLPFYLGDNFLVQNSAIKRTTTAFVAHIWDNVLTYNNTFGDHNITLMAGTSFRDESMEMLTARGIGFPVTDKESWYIRQSANIPANDVDDDGARLYGLSYFGRLAYNYKDKYLAYATMRADGTSKYQTKWGYFPSFGAGWVVSEESFLQDNGVVDFLKIRGGWGRLGNDRIAASEGARTSSIVNLAINDQLRRGVVSGNNFSYLPWEVVEETNIGLTSKLMNSRLSLDMDYFIRDTENAVIAVIPPITEAYRLPVGEIRNSGFEFSLTWEDNLPNGITYTIGANATMLNNEVRSLYGQPYLDGGSAEFRQRSIVGEPLLAFFGYEVAGVYQNNEQVQADPVAVANNLVPGDLRFRDQNGDNLINDQDRVVLGSYIPTFTYGANLGAAWKNFEFSMNIMGQRGNKILNRKRGEVIWTADGNMDADLAKNRWHGEGTSDRYPSAAGLRKGWNQRMSDYFVEDGAFFRIQNVQIAYNLPVKTIAGVSIPATRIAVTAERPLTVFNYNGFNPEVPNGIDTQTYPIPAVYTVGLNVKF